MDEFCSLAEQVKMYRNSYRVNVHPGEELRIDKNGGKWLKKGPL